MLSMFKQTRAEKRANIGALNLFFGALLGANLGTLTELPARDYLVLILYLVAAVAAVQMVGTSARRLSALGMIAAIGSVLVLSWFEPSIRPGGLTLRQYENILITLGVWLTMVVAQELIPLAKSTD